MTTKVFISWSGSLSNEIANAVYQWLPGVLQFVKPYFTPSDIEKGTKWSSDIARELEASDIGIICLTKDNLTNPWILFESGALSKNIDTSKVCVLLFGIEQTDIKGPLTIFQATTFEKFDFKKLVKSINSSAGDNKLEDEILDQVFDMWWDKLKSQIDEILLNNINSSKIERRSERDILEEILEISRYTVKKRVNISELSPAILLELLEGLLEIQRIAEKQNSRKLLKAEKQLRKPIDYILTRSEFPDLFEHIQMRRNNISDAEHNCGNE